MREWLWRLAAMWRRERAADERSDELRFHFEMEVDAARARGLSEDDARRHAQFRVGSVPQAVVTAHEAVGIRWMDALGRDMRQAARALRRDPGFSVVAALVLTSSVAVATLVFVIFDAVLLRPLPYVAPERLVRVFDVSPTTPRFPMAIGRYLDYRQQAQSLDGLALYTGRDVELSGDGARSTRLTGVAVTSEFFSLLGASPVLGRGFTEADLRRDVRHVVLSHRVWRERLNGDREIVGKVVRVNREPWTVIGVLPEGFSHVGGEYRSPIYGDNVDVWLPLPVDGQEMELRAAHFCNAIGRLREGFSLAQAQQELALLAAGYSREHARFGTWTARVTSLADEVTDRSRTLITLLAVAGGLVLLVACANVAGLCVARGLSRGDELTVRSALGASRWQLARVSLAENLLIGLSAGVAGWVTAALSVPIVRSLLPGDFARAHEITWTMRSAAFALMVAVVAVLAATLLTPNRDGVQRAVRRVTTDRRNRRLRTALVVAEMTVAGILCAATILLWRSYVQLSAVDHGFRTDSVLTFQVTIPSVGDTAPGAVGRRVEDIRSAIAAIGGVSTVGATTNLPWSGYDENTNFSVVGRDVADDSLNTRYQAATPGYFEAIGMRLLEGRLLDAGRDVKGQPLTLVLNDAAARLAFPAGDAIGARVRVFGEDREVVGVVRGLRDHPADPSVRPGLWFPHAQVEFESVFFAVHTAGTDPLTLLPAIRAAVQRIDAELPLADVADFADRAGKALASQRAALALFQLFAVLALALAAAGLYGLLSYVVHQRRKEFGIRAAVGATHAHLTAVVLRDSLRTAAIGAVACLLTMPVVAMLLSSALYGTSVWDPVALMGTPLALLATAMLASIGPARTATRHADMRALREN